MEELKDKLKDLKVRIDDLAQKLDLAAKHRDIRELQVKTLKPDFWTDETQAKNIMRQLADLQGEVNTLEDLTVKVQELLALVDLAQAEIKPDQLQADLEKDKMFKVPSVLDEELKKRDGTNK